MIYSLSVDFRPHKTFPCTRQYRKQQIADHGKARVVLQGVVAIAGRSFKAYGMLHVYTRPMFRAGFAFS